MRNTAKQWNRDSQFKALTKLADGINPIDYFPHARDKRTNEFTKMARVLCEKDPITGQYNYNLLDIVKEGNLRQIGRLNSKFDQEEFVKLFTELLEEMCLGLYIGKEGRSNLRLQILDFFARNVEDIIKRGTEINDRIKNDCLGLDISQSTKTMQLFHMLASSPAPQPTNVRAFLEQHGQELDYNLALDGRTLIQTATKSQLFEIAALIRDAAKSAKPAQQTSVASAVKS